MKAIETKYLPATNYRGSRIKAKAEGGNSITINYPHEYNTERAHSCAAFALCQKMGWNADTLCSGGTDKGYVFCFVDSVVKLEDLI